MRGTPWSQEAIAPSLTVDQTSWPDLPLPVVDNREDHLLAGFPGVLARIWKRPFRLEYWATEAGEAPAAGARPSAEMAGAWVTVEGQAAGGATGPAAPAAGALLDPIGEPLLADSPGGGLWMDGWQVGVKFQLHHDDQFFGVGEPDQRKGEVAVNHRGRKYPVWHKHLPAPSRMVLPVVISQKGYGLFIDNPWVAEWDLGIDGRSFGYTAQGGQFVCYFIAGPALTTVLDRYTRLTGRPSLAPKWAFGLLQSKFGYRDRAEVSALIDTFDAKEIPVDSVILDLFWFKRMGDLAFDRTAFPDPAGMLRELRRRGIRTIVIEEPYITKASRLYPEAERLGLLGKRPDGSAYTFPFWAGETGLVDFTQPLAKQWWADQHKPLMDLGIAGWWTDLNEPEEHPPDMQHHAGPPAAVHNVYALHMLKAIAIAQEQHKPDERLFILSRSGWPGTQALGAGQWSGDVATRWDAFANQIPLGLSMAMAGMAYWNTDIGGFAGERPDAELYIRWVQFGAFTPTMRPHGAHQEREPWAFGPEAEAIAAQYIKLRYRLLPYTYTLAREAQQSGMPFMRPLLLHYPADLRTLHLRDQYLWGREILVAPVVTQGATSRKVYLPEGEWYDFETNRRIKGGRYVTAAAPIATMPMYVRAGAILPLAPERLRTGGAWEALTLAVYPGADPSSFTLYEDDGETTAFERGGFATTTFTCERLAGGLELIIGETEGDFAELPARRRYSLAVRLAKRPVAVAAGEVALIARRSGESLAKAANGWWYDGRAKVLHVRLAPAAGAQRILIG